MTTILHVLGVLGEITVGIVILAAVVVALFGWWVTKTWGSM